MPGDIFLNVSNYGTIEVTAGVNSGGTSTTVNFDGFFSESSGHMTIGANARVNVDDFESDGHLTPDPGTGSGGLFTVLTNRGTSDLTFAGGGSTHTLISDTTHSGARQLLRRHHRPAWPQRERLKRNRLAGYRGLFKNEGAIIDTVSGTGHVIADFGYVEGGGYFQSSVVTIEQRRVPVRRLPRHHDLWRFGSRRRRSEQLSIPDRQRDGNRRTVAGCQRPRRRLEPGPHRKPRLDG